MRTTRIYQPGHYELHSKVPLSEPQAHHVAKVLRMRPGESIVLFRGDNREFSAVITSIKKHQVIVRIEDVKNVNRESPCTIHLAQGIAKKEHMQFIIQKAVELGVASITPLFTQHAAIKNEKKPLEKKRIHWQAIAISACEQSGRNLVPTIHEPIAFDHFLESCNSQHRFILDPKSTGSWRDISEVKRHDISLLIGPEGGLSHEEVNIAKALNFKSLSLGPRILRTETATLAALSVLQALEGDL